MLRLRRPLFIRVEPLRFLVLGQEVSRSSSQFFLIKRSLEKFTARTAALRGIALMVRSMLSQMRMRSLKSGCIVFKCRLNGD